MKTTKRALFSSVVALILCFSMLVGTTFAWFTDSVESGVNQIVAGNLDIELYNDLQVNESKKVTNETKLFNEITYWEPGVVAYENLTVANLGTLALKYQLSVNFDNATTNANDETLAKVLKVGFVEGGIKSSTREGALAEVKTWLPLASFVQAGTLEKQNDTNVYGIVIYWEPSDIDNEFNMNNGLTNTMSIDLGIKLVATQLTAESDSFGPEYDGAAQWLGGVDYSWYDPDATEVTIGNAEQLAGLAAIVNGTATSPVTTFAADGDSTVQDSFEGVTFTLTSDINLNNLPWTPIGNWDNTFAGTFDGNGHTISNLYINAPQGEGIGFFGVVQNATIKGLTLHNVNVNAYSMVAGVVGATYPASISDCHITGDVNIVADWAYVAGVAGYCYYGTQVDGCSVIAEGTGLIQSVTRNAVGGITAWLLEGDHKVTDCHVKNLNLVGWTNVGGITGFVHYNNTIEGCSVENVKLTKTRVDGNPGIGLIAGGWSYSASNAITLRNNTVKNATMEGTHIAYAAYNELYGSEYGGATTANFVLENNTTENITNTLKVITPVADAIALKAALTKSGDNYVLTKDIAVTETITVPNGVEVVLDLNGKTIIGTFSGTGNQEMFLVKGNLTVKNGSIEMTATQNQGWNAMATIFDVTAGGVLDMEKVTATVGGSDMNFIVHLNNWGSATLNVNNCDFTASYVAIRAFNSGYDMNNVVVKNTAFHGGRVFWVHNYTAEGKDDSTLNVDIYGNGNTTDNAKPVRYGFSNSLYFDINGNQIVSDAATLDAALLNGGNVTLAEDMIIDTTKTTANSGYGATGVSVKGGVLDGNGHSLGIDNWGTWDAAVHTTGGTIKNLTINSGMRGIFMGSATADVYIENVVIDGTIYTFNSDGGDKNYGVYISNSTLNGWTSHSDVHKEVVYTNCEFGEGQGYKFCRPYGPTKFVGCDFSEGYKVDPVGAVVFENCTINGVALTAENVATLVTNTANVTVK